MVTTESPGRTHIEVAQAALEGGAKVIQYRDKNASSRTLYERARELRKITREAGVLLIINDRLDIALAVGADGVHLGKDDMPFESAREIMGASYIIGISATNYEEAAAAQGADYIGLGPIYPTPSKDDAAEPIGLQGLNRTRSSVSVPIVAIGGITADNVEEIITAGADGVALISAVASAQDMVHAAQTLTHLIERAKSRR
jgi:thiamine-phosphate pyrophosphorylase